MGFNENRFISPLFKLFGKRLAGVPPSPQNNDVIQFNSTSNQWELISGVIGNAVQSSSNVGTGDGLALPRVLDDLPFKTLVDGVEIVITVSAQELTFSIGAIAISKITGLQVILDSKIETITNVGGFNELIKAKVAQDVPVRTIQAGTNITITQNADDLEISATNTGEDNTASNVGTGVNVFLQKLGVDFEFRTLLANAEILITQNALDLAFSIGAIAQSKITGLVTALASKIETLTNVGTGAEIVKAKVGTNVDVRKIKAGTGITVNQLTDEIEIVNSQPPPTSETKIHIDIFARDDSRNWGNMPLALTEIFGRLTLRSKTDLDNFTQARLVINIDTIGAVGADIHAEYDAGLGFLELADVSGAGDLLIDNLGTLLMLDTGWFDIDALAQVTDVTIRLVGENGDGATDPRFGHISLEFRT